MDGFDELSFKLELADFLEKYKVSLCVDSTYEIIVECNEANSKLILPTITTPKELRK